MFGHQDDKQTDDNNTAQDQGDRVEDLNLSLPGSTPALESDSSDQPATDDTLREALSPAGGYPQLTTQKVHPATETDDADLADIADGDLVVVKTQALNELFPLIDKLDQTPDERFRTLMMMIQASDNQHLIKAAYEAAHQISDEKVRAQALLDVVNEINYFTHQPES
jgi:hypothetical protein